MSYILSVIDGMAVICLISYIWCIATIVISRKAAIQPDCHKLAQNARKTISQPVMEPFFYLYPLFKATNIITSQFSTY